MAICAKPLIIADGFYEFTEPEDIKQKRKTKWLFTMRDHDWFCIAGIWRSTAEGEAFTAQAAALGVPASEVSQIAEAWRAWGREPGAMFVIPHAELLASPAR